MKARDWRRKWNFLSHFQHKELYKLVQNFSLDSGNLSVSSRFTLITDSGNSIAAASLKRAFVGIKIKPVKQMKELQQMNQ